MKYDAFLLFFLSSDFTSDFGAVISLCGTQDLDCEVPAWTLMLRNVVWFSPSAVQIVLWNSAVWEAGGPGWPEFRDFGWDMVRYIISSEYLPKHLQINEISRFSMNFEGSVAFKIPRWTFLHCPSIPASLRRSTASCSEAVPHATLSASRWRHWISYNLFRETQPIIRHLIFMGLLIWLFDGYLGGANLNGV